MLRSRFIATSSLMLSLAAADAACGQSAPRSQLGTVSQLIAGTRVEIVYRRPVARGRTLFGSLVPYGRIWTPSADSAARLTTTGPIEINGAALPAGSYSVWAIPDSASWKVVINREAVVFHLRYPEGSDVLRVDAKPRQGEHVETLMFSFPVADADSARLELHWGTTIVPLTIRATRP